MLITVYHVIFCITSTSHLRLCRNTARGVAGRFPMVHFCSRCPRRPHLWSCRVAVSFLFPPFKDQSLIFSTKRVVRRRVKKGTFSVHNSGGTGSWAKAIRSRGKNSAPQSASQQQMSQMSQMSQRRDPRGSTMSGSRQGVTFGRIEERSILREMDLLDENLEDKLEGDGPRRGSEMDSVNTKGTATSGKTGASGGSGQTGATASSTAARTDASGGSGGSEGTLQSEFKGAGKT